MPFRAGREPDCRAERLPAARPVAPAPDARLAARFGVEVLAGGYTAVPNLVLRYAPRLGLSNGELLLIQYIWQHWWPADQPHPSVPTLARAMSKSVRMVRYYLQGLRDKGLLRLEERFGSDGNRQSNTYNLQPLIAAVVALAEADGRADGAAAGQGAADQALQGVLADRCRDPLQFLAALKEIPEDPSTRANQFPGQKSTGESAVDPVHRGVASPDASSVSTDPGRTPDPTSRRQDPAYGALTAPLQALAREFGDGAHPRVSLARAHNLYREARIGQDEFLGLLDEAAARTRSAKSRLSRTDPGARSRRDNLMPYLFATLEGVLGEAAKARMKASPGCPVPEERKHPGPASSVPADAAMHPVWGAVLAELRAVMTAENYRRWLAPTHVVAEQAGTLVVAVPTALHKHWLGQRLRHLIDDALRCTAPAGTIVQYTLEDDRDPRVSSEDRG
ncbi:MAG: DnaA N-terminal domain-containing protein [Chloroflexota bacterium]